MRVFYNILWLTLTLGIALPTWAQEPTCTGNAAVHYWCAAAVMTRPADEKEEKVLDDIEARTFLAPKLFIENHDDVTFLEQDLRPGAAMDMLHIGAACTQCDFDVAAMDGGAIPPMKMLRALGKRAWAMATMLEGQGQLERAAQVHADAVQFSVHLCQCPDVMYALTGTAVMQGSLAGMNEFLARKPGKAPIRALMLRLITMPSRPISFSACMADEGKTVPLMLKREARLSDADLDRSLQAMDNDFFGRFEILAKMGVNYKTLFGQLRSLKPDERATAYGKWADQVGNELSELAKAGEGSFAEARPRVMARIEHMEKLGKPAKGQTYPENPLLGEFLSAGNPHEMFAVSNARLAMSKLMVAAALHEAETGQYPTSLETLRGYFPQGLPKDPFTESDFDYKIEEGSPVVSAHPPDDVRQGRIWDFRISLAGILKKQAESLERYRKETSSSPADTH